MKPLLSEFARLVARGHETASAAKVLGVSPRTAEGWRRRDDVRELIEALGDAQVTPDEVLRGQLLHHDRTAQRGAAIALKRGEQQAADGDGRITLSQPMVFYVEPPACPRCGFEHEPTTNKMVLAGLTPDDAATVERLNSKHVQDVPVPTETEPTESQATGHGLLVRDGMLADAES